MSLNTTAVRITLKDVKPQVMRCLGAPVTLRLDRLHLTLQAAFGWTNSHLFEILAGDGRWGTPDPDGDFDPQPIDARKARLCDIVRETGARTIHYLYDELSLKVGDGGNRKGGISWGCLTPPLLHRRSDMPCRKITSSS
jgi:Plasmid pRiA4b ORF-3-like protein